MMPRNRAPRYPLEPVLTYTGANVLALARRLDVHQRVAQRWHAEGIPEPAADRVACALGLHPLLLWPEFYDALSDD
jgi:hypothetical protein